MQGHGVFTSLSAGMDAEGREALLASVPTEALLERCDSIPVDELRAMLLDKFERDPEQALRLGILAVYIRHRKLFEGIEPPCDVDLPIDDPLCVLVMNDFIKELGLVDDGEGALHVSIPLNDLIKEYGEGRESVSIPVNA